MNVRYIASGFRQDMETLFSLFCTTDYAIDDLMDVKTKLSTSQQSAIACSNDTEDRKPAVSSAPPKPTTADSVHRLTTEAVSLRFSRFCEKWRSLKFSYVFYLRHNDNELREFIDECYLEVLPHVAAEHALERRVAALYLLYSLFTKQPKPRPTSRPQRIRINYGYLQQMRQLVHTCKQLQQLDVCYIWYKLLSMGAVQFVHVSRLMGPYYIRNGRVTNQSQTKTDFLIDQFQTSMNPPFDELSHIHEKYRAMKEGLYEDNPLTRQMDQIQDNLFELSKAKMQNLAKDFTNMAVPSSTVNDTVDSHSSTEEDDQSMVTIGEKRRKLKERAFGFGNKSTNETNIETDGKTTDDQRPRKAPKRRGRPTISKLTDIM